ncbi:hypothetical protein [Ruminococcus sp.]|jgi:hypothetical protein|uniref:hypothetical protein n=1 Tax=Ruminococcus sp. TaxID=41978 RepID=UPI0025EB314B|nr:hypothetical protein [Ruminococcus sp.]
MAEQKETIFRRESLERISSPEQLTEYLRVTNVGIWVVLASIIVLLGGLIAWSMVGNLETVEDSVAVIEDGHATLMVTDRTYNEISSGMTVRINNDEYSISSVGKDDYGRTVAYAEINKADGKYEAEIVTESVHPIKFLFN